MVVSSSLTCIILTTMGRVLLQCEGDNPLPLHVPGLALLLASLLQFATPRQTFAHVQLQNGVSVVMSVDAAASVACAVLYSGNSLVDDERARLTSLVVLRAFLANFDETVARIVEENRVDAERMAEAYTLTRALDGGSSGASSRGEVEDRDGTMEAFLGFHHEVVVGLLGATDEVVSYSPSNGAGKVEGLGVLHMHVMNAETGVSLSRDSVVSIADEKQNVVASYAAQQLVRRAARALQLAFPVLNHSHLLQQRNPALKTPSSFLVQEQDQTLGLDISAATLVLRLTAPESTTLNYNIAIRMFHHGIFAAVVHYTHDNSGVFRGRDCALLRDGHLQRVLMSDPRGAALTRFLQDAETSTAFSVHIGVNDVPPAVLTVTEKAFLFFRAHDRSTSRCCSSSVGTPSHPS